MARPLIRFGFRQKSKLRPCDNGRSSGSNDGTSTLVQLKCVRADFPFRASIASADAAAKRSCSILNMIGGTDDLADAYRHIPCADPRFTVVAIHGGCYHGAAYVPHELRLRFGCKAQLIHQIELVVAIAPYLTFPLKFAGKRVVNWIDNRAALSALTKGYARPSASAHSVHAFHSWNALAKSDVWFEYMKSAANPADQPSRDLLLVDVLWQVSSDVAYVPARIVFQSLENMRDINAWSREASIHGKIALDSN